MALGVNNVSIPQGSAVRAIAARQSLDKQFASSVAKLVKGASENQQRFIVDILTEVLDMYPSSATRENIERNSAKQYLADGIHFALNNNLMNETQKRRSKDILGKYLQDAENLNRGSWIQRDTQRATQNLAAMNQPFVQADLTARQETLQVNSVSSQEES